MTEVGPTTPIPIADTHHNNARFKQTTARLMWLVSLILLPTSCLPALEACNAINPMAQAFKASFSVTNNSSETALVTPIGTVGKEGKRLQLPILRNSRFCVRSAKRRDFAIDPHQTLVLSYDWDDINFSEIFIQSRSGRGMIVVNPEPTQRQYHLPAKLQFEFNSLAELTPASDPVIQAAAHPDGTPLTYRLLMVSGCLAPVLYLCARHLCPRNDRG